MRSSGARRGDDVTWDDLDDAIDLCRQISIQQSPSPTDSKPMRASDQSNRNQKSRRRASDEQLPTVQSDRALANGDRDAGLSRSADARSYLTGSNGNNAGGAHGHTAAAEEEMGGGGKPFARRDSTQPWTCPTCTFLNENPLHLVCAMCGTAKVASKQPPPSNPPNAPLEQTAQSSRGYGRKDSGPMRGLSQSKVQKDDFDDLDDEDSYGSYDVEAERNYQSRTRREKGGMSSSASGSRSMGGSVSGSRSGGSVKSGGRSISSKKKNRTARCKASKSVGNNHDEFNEFEVGGRQPRAGNFDDFESESDECSDLSDEHSLIPDDNTIKTMQTIKTLKVPTGDVTIIYTDVQGSTSLWEADAASMKRATDIHDSVIRKCYAEHGGYEITTEGDAFNLAFQHPADAIGFALKAQLLLYRARWPDGTLRHPDGNFNEKKAFRGFRVRFGMHHGPTTSCVHETTGRTIYEGEAVDIAKAIEKMSHGGQILTTVQTWRAVSGMAEQFLGKPQVMDCGEHLLWDPKKAKPGDRVTSKRIVQLVPNQLAYDFFAARGGQRVEDGEAPAPVCGRVFPPLLSNGQLSTSFLNAPYLGNRVAMVFVYTDKMESCNDKDRARNHSLLAKYIRSHLMRLTPPGYECQEDRGSWMLAFDRIENGIKFGLDLNETVRKSSDIRGKVKKTKLFRIGIHWGPFLSMGPHIITGHADYFGPIVNRAARVAAQCEPGQVCVGVPMGDDEEPPDPGPSVDVDVLGVKQLKGISIEMAIFACRKRESE